MGTVSTSFLPNSTGLDLGSTSQRWDAFLQNLSVTGNAGTVDFDAITTAKLNNIRFADQFPGATADVQINAAIADLPSTGGIVDCRGYATTAQTIAGQVPVGTATKRVCLIFDARTLFRITVSNNIIVFPIADGSCVTAEPILGPQNFNNVYGFTLDPTAVVQSVFGVPTSVTGGILTLRGVTIIAQAGSTCNSAIVDLHDLFVGTFLENITIYLLTGCVGFKFTPGTFGMSDVEMLNCQSNGVNTASARPCVLNGTGSTQQIASLDFISCAFQHAGAGQYEIEIDGLNGGVGGVPGVQTVVFSAYHHESSAGSLGIKIRDACNVKFGPSLAVSGAGSNNVFTISESVASLVQDIEIGAAYEVGAAVNWVVNSCVGGTTVATANATQMPEYQFNTSINNTGTGTVKVPTLTVAGVSTLTGAVAALSTLAVSGNTTLAKITSYNAIATVGNGVPAEYAVVDLTAQTAAIGTTTLYTVPAAAGQYRLCWNAKITTAATTGAATSTLGPLTIVYTDPDSVAVTLTAAAQIAAGTIATSSAANTTGTVLVGVPMLLNCKAATVISYATGYASNTAAQMAHNLHITLERL